MKITNRKINMYLQFELYLTFDYRSFSRLVPRFNWWSSNGYKAIEFGLFGVILNVGISK